MKKLMLSIAVLGLLSTNAFAIWVEGTVSQVRIQSTGTKIILLKSNDALQSIDVSSALTADQHKAFLAAAMTAYSSGATVVVSGSSTDATDIFLK